MNKRKKIFWRIEFEEGEGTYCTTVRGGYIIIYLYVDCRRIQKRKSWMNAREGTEGTCMKSSDFMKTFCFLHCQNFLSIKRIVTTLLFSSCKCWRLQKMLEYITFISCLMKTVTLFFTFWECERCWREIGV